MKQVYFIALAALLLASPGRAQSVSVLQEQSQHYSQFQLNNDAGWDSLRATEGQPLHIIPSAQHTTSTCTPTKRVFGWHPYWNGNTYLNYRWNLLTDLCYFDYTVSPNTGNNTNASFQWSTSPAVTTAINNGVNVHICATLFSNHSTFLASSSAQQTFITNIISLLQARGGKGVNIDFEGMGASNRIAFTSFMTSLCSQVHAAIANSEVSIALYSVDWNSVFDIPTLAQSVDLFIIMGYDYYYGGSTTAGPTDPLYNFQTSYNFTLSKSITAYLKQGLSASKLLLGLPYYGREWETTSSSVPSATTGNYSATKTYGVVRANVNGYYSSRQWDVNSFTPYYVFQVSGNWRQCFMDDAYSLKKRYDVVNQRGIGGIGIWALGYDDGYSELWDAIQDKLSNCEVVPCTDTIYDMGGPTRNYYDSENFTYTIAPAGATSVSLNFNSFDTEANFDTLWIYNGNSVNAPLIGAYHGTNSPGTVLSTGPTLTLRFKSDNATTNPGWYAVWNCSVDNIAPTTTISTPPGWITQDFTANFTDQDASGIEKSFYSVNDFDGTEWRANAANGFFNDDFDQTALNTDWTVMNGTWTEAFGALTQSDENISNTNVYAALAQSLSNRYLYQWKGKISGTGNNRRAGFHFFSDNGSLTNRGNSYFVWFRVDQQTLEFYKVINDVFTLETSVPFNFQVNTWYDYKVFYDRILGRIDVYVDDALAGSWTDASPYALGSYISFRSGNSNWAIDSFRVYRSRTPSVTVTVGNASSDLRYQNPNPTTPAGRIASIVRDNAANLSAVTAQLLDVDWTPPATVNVFDGTATDIDTTYSLTQLDANWTASADSNSGLAEYEYAIGTTSGDSDLVAWTSNSLSTAVSQSPLLLVPGQWYYFDVRAYNGAGLRTSNLVSNGQVVMLSTGIPDASDVLLSVSPNPFGDQLTVRMQLPVAEKISVALIDMTGREISLAEEAVSSGAQELRMNVPTDVSKGLYLLRLRVGGHDYFAKLARQ